MTEGLERTNKYSDINAPAWIVHSVRDIDVLAVEFSDGMHRVVAFNKSPKGDTKYADRSMGYKLAPDRRQLEKVADEYRQRLLTEHIEI
jgi:hypothetical protein